jgi:hypothetical protein
MTSKCSDTDKENLLKYLQEIVDDVKDITLPGVNKKQFGENIKNIIETKINMKCFLDLVTSTKGKIIADDIQRNLRDISQRLINGFPPISSLALNFCITTLKDVIDFLKPKGYSGQKSSNYNNSYNNTYNNESNTFNKSKTFNGTEFPSHIYLKPTSEDTPETIKQQYRKLSLKYHPDKCPPEQKIECTEKFQQINNEYSAIKPYLGSSGGKRKKRNNKTKSKRRIHKSKKNNKKNKTRRIRKK